jgi:group I intron endonuclease
MRKKICGIYKITSPSGNFYIGSSVDVLSRWNGHKTDLRKGKHHCEPLQRAAIKYGVDSLSMEIIECCSAENVRSREQKYIDELRPSYNSSRCVREPLSDLWKDPEFRKKGIDRAKRQSAEWRNNPEWRKKQKESARLALSKLHKDPDFREAHAIRATERIQRLVNSSEKMKEKAAEGRRKRIASDRENPEAWSKRNAKIRALISTPILCVETGIIFSSQVEAGKWLNEQYGFKTFRHISNAIAGRAEKAYGFHWRKA